MRGWGIFLAGFLGCSLDLSAAQLPEKLYFDGNQFAKDALVLEYRKSHPEATAKYLQARKLYLEILKEYPAWQIESGLVQKKLSELDARLRPLLLTQGIPPGSIIRSPDSLQAKTLPEKVKPLPSHVSAPEASKKGMSIDEEIAALRALQAKGETKIPDSFGHKSARPPAADSPPTSVVAKASAPLSLNQTEKIARLQIEKQQIEQDLAKERQDSLKREAVYQTRLRAALAARPKSLEPGEMAKQVTANQALRKDFEYLKVQSKRGESDLLDALEQLEQTREESELLRKKFRELQAENQQLRRALSNPR